MKKVTKYLTIGVIILQIAILGCLWVVNEPLRVYNETVVYNEDNDAYVIKFCPYCGDELEGDNK